MLSYLNRARAKRANGEDGFTLIELLVVVVILGILIAIAIPVYLNYRKSAYDKAAQSDLRGAISTLEVCNSDGNTYPYTVAADGTMTGCATSGASVKLSQNVTVTTYTTTPSTASASAPATAYIMVTKNSGGSNWYCYNSTNGGTIKNSSTVITTC